MRAHGVQLSWDEEEPTAYAATLERFDSDAFIAAVARELPSGSVERIGQAEYDARFRTLLMRDTPNLTVTASKITQQELGMALRLVMLDITRLPDGVSPAELLRRTQALLDDVKIDEPSLDIVANFARLALRQLRVETRDPTASRATNVGERADQLLADAGLSRGGAFNACTESEYLEALAQAARELDGPPPEPEQGPEDALAEHARVDAVARKILAETGKVDPASSEFGVSWTAGDYFQALDKAVALERAAQRR
jgi:hypothetical protein